jgi:hypothetical protein
MAAFIYVQLQTMAIVSLDRKYDVSVYTNLHNAFMGLLQRIEKFSKTPPSKMKSLKGYLKDAG